MPFFRESGRVSRFGPGRVSMDRSWPCFHGSGPSIDRSIRTSIHAIDPAMHPWLCWKIAHVGRPQQLQAAAAAASDITTLYTQCPCITSMLMPTHMSMHMPTHMSMHMRTHNVYATCPCTCPCAYYARMSTCMLTWMFTRMSTRMSTHPSLHICLHTCLYTCLHTYPRSVAKQPRLPVPPPASCAGRHPPCRSHLNLATSRRSGHMCM